MLHHGHRALDLRGSGWEGAAAWLLLTEGRRGGAGAHEQHLKDWIGLDWIGLDWIGLDWIGAGAHEQHVAALRIPA